jgi:transglutaminase-like putative cysteine protease
MKYRVTHITNYEYTEPVSLCHNLAHLKLRMKHGQNDVVSHLKIEPLPSVSREFKDFFGNQVNYFVIQQAHKQLKITAISNVNVIQIPSYQHISTLAWNEINSILNQNTHEEILDAKMFTLDSPHITSNQNLFDYAAPSFPLQRPILEAVIELMNRIHSDFIYDPNSTDIATPLEEVLVHRRGVCQDFAHLAIGCLRSLGLPARYVSGYMETLPPPGKPKLRGADASHAWFSTYIPRIGWLDFDPTNNLIPVEQHITTAIGRDFGDVTPVKGVLYGGGEHKLTVSVDVERLIA